MDFFSFFSGGAGSRMLYFSEGEINMCQNTAIFLKIL